MELVSAIKRVTGGGDLNSEEMSSVMRLIMSGASTDAQNAAFLVGLQMKGVRPAELLGGASVMRELATLVNVSDHSHLVDTCGTGGSGSNKFTVSTASALGAATAGAKVAKHGYRGATSKSGSADVLEAAGVSLSLGAKQIGHCIDRVGVGFMFAPAHHDAMKHVIPARREIGVRTVFNLLGPLTNPAGAPNQIVGVFDTQWIPTILETLKGLGSRHVLVVASDDGLDEITITGDSHVAELNQGKFSTYEINPKHFGIEIASIEQIVADSPKTSLQMVLDAFNGSKTPVQDMIALNAGSALYISGIAKDIKDGIDLAYATMHSGKAAETLAMYVDSSK